MSHIFIEEGQGTSDKSLSAALANAMGDALGYHKFDGDHQCTISVVIDGYFFDGKTYRVKLRVVIFDHELAQEDLYHAVEQQHHDQEEQEKFMGAYYAATLHAHLFTHHRDHLSHELKDMFEHHLAPSAHIDGFTLVAPQEFHDIAAQELGYTPGAAPVYPKAHTDLSDPTLGAGYHGSGSEDDKAA
jgi:hypothetical protein